MFNALGVYRFSKMVLLFSLCIVPAPGFNHEVYAAPEALTIAGSVTQWQPLPRFAREERAAEISAQRLKCSDVGDVDFDGKQEVVALSEDGKSILMHTFVREEKAVRERKLSTVSTANAEVTVVVGVLDGIGYRDIAVFDPSSGDADIYLLSGEGNVTTFKEKKLFSHGRVVKSTRRRAWENADELWVIREDGEKLVRDRLVWENGTQQFTVESLYEAGGTFIDFWRPVVYAPPYPIFEEGRGNYVSPGGPDFPLTSAMPPEGLSWLLPISGDFNGDAFSDLIFLARRISAAWIAIGTKDGFIEQPLTGIFGATDAIRALDVNGDGLDDLVGAKDGRYLIFTNLPGPPVSGANVSNGAGQKVSADSQGRFSIAAGDSNTTSLTASMSGDREVKTVLVDKVNRVTLALSSQHEKSKYSRDSLTSLFPGPYPCIGYHVGDASEKWGRQTICPPKHAVMEADDGKATFTPMLCCKLPADDILKDEGQWMEAHVCPAGSVVTGIRGAPGDRFGVITPDKPPFLRCAKLSDRYTLGPATPGTYWGLGQSSLRRHGGVNRYELPVAIRSGVGRTGFGGWDPDGCIGSPLGSLLVTEPARSCEQVRFAQVLTRDVSPSGTGALRPVIMLPDCRRLSSYFDPLAKCEEE